MEKLKVNSLETIHIEPGYKVDNTKESLKIIAEKVNEIIDLLNSQIIQEEVKKAREEEREKVKEEVIDNIEKIDFVEAFATHPSRCWHREAKDSVEKEREENLQHIQAFKDFILKSL